MNNKSLLGFQGTKPAVFFLLMGLAGTVLGATCGVDHWVDSTAAGTDTFNSIANAQLDTDLNGTPDVTLTPTGPTTVVRGNPQDTPDPLDPGHFNRIPTEITSLVLTGGGYTLRAGSGEGVTPSTVGAILEKTGGIPSPADAAAGVTAANLVPADPKLAFSYFNVYFELTGTPYGPLHNKIDEPLRLRTTISGVPPIGRDYAYPISVGLYDTTDVLRMTLIHAVHRPCAAGGDCTPPSCSVSITPQNLPTVPHTFLTATVRDTGTGLDFVDAWGNNVTLTLPTFTSGTTDPQSVIAEKIDETPATVSVCAKDVAGNTTLCDPTVTTLTVTNRGPARQTFRGIPQDESFISIQNIGSGIRGLDIKVNDQKIRVAGLAENEIRVINLSSALTAGDNTVTLIGYGLPGASAVIAIGDGSLVPPPQGLSKTLKIGGHSHSAQTSFADVAQQQSLLTIYNGNPGLDRLAVNVNGWRFKYVALGKNEVMRTIDMSSVMNSMEDNVIDLIGYGQAGASAVVSIPSHGNASE